MSPRTGTSRSTIATDRRHERIVWRAPRASATTRRNAPLVLRFRTDDFMAELETLLAEGRGGLDAETARHETWRDDQPPLFPVPAPTAVGTDPTGPVKLYQPAQGRFYLVAAHATCRRTGFPDRRFDAGESAGFVLRRVQLAPGATGIDVDDPSSFDEFAWLAGPGVWHRAGPGALVEGEEVLPLAPTTHVIEGRRSRLLTGLVPVGARERYEASPVVATPVETTSANDPLADPREALIAVTVVGAIRSIRDRSGDLAARPDRRAVARDALVFALLDLHDVVVDMIGSDVASFDPAGPLDAAVEGLAGPTTWRQVVADVADHRDDLLAGARPALVADDIPLGDGNALFLRLNTLLAGLESALVTALPAPDPPPPPPVGEPDDVADPVPPEGATYVLRCVYRRAGCARPAPEWISDAAGPFRFASFYDSDAPARPVQIPMPVDTSPASLRAHPRNVRIQLTKELRNQIERARNMTSFTDDLGGPGSFDLGMVCSLSIPIVTICALILLIILVSILNIVFYWMPLFKICLPKASP